MLNKLLILVLLKRTGKKKRGGDFIRFKRVIKEFLVFLPCAILDKIMISKIKKELKQCVINQGNV